MMPWRVVTRPERIFRDDFDRRFFVKTLGEACARTGWRVHAWVLMSNHYHLMLQTPAANPVEGPIGSYGGSTTRMSRFSAGICCRT
jgi:REP element-mobilizing transposase RayT